MAAKFLLALLLPASALAQVHTIAGPFSGLNDSNSSITIGDGEAQSTLNVEVSEDGLALKKRKGYTSYADLDVATSPVYGSAYFKNASGDNVKIFAHNKFVSASINGGAFTNIVTTATVGARWSFCSTDGRIYGFNSAGDEVWYSTGSTAIYMPDIPKGSLCAVTIDRMLVSGTTDFPNRVYFSQSGDVTNYTVDIEPEDPGFEAIGSAGEKVTVIFATQSEWLIFKRNSMVSYQGTNQYDLVPIVVSEKVGMIDPNAIVQHEGIVYFKGSDGRIWAYNSGSLTEISKSIDTFISGVTKDAVNSVVYTSKENFDGGTYLYATGDRTAGSVTPTLDDFTDTTNADFNAGAVAGSSVTVGNDSVYMSAFPTGQFPNIGGELGTTDNWTGTITGADSGLAYYGSYALYYEWPAADSYSCGWGIKDLAGNLLHSDILSGTNLLFLSGFPDVIAVVIRNCIDAQSAYFKRAGNYLTIRGINGQCSSSCTGKKIGWDLPETHPIASSATFISHVSTITTADPRIGYFIATDTEPANSTIDYSVRWSSAVGGPFSSWVGTTNYALLPGSTNQYWQWKADISNPYSYLPPTVYDAGLKFATTGYWETPEINTTGMTSWGSFNVTDTLTGPSTWTYTLYRSSYSGGTSAATPTTLTPNAVVTASTESYAKVRATNFFYASSDTTRMDSLSLAWNITPEPTSAAFEFKGDIYFSLPYQDTKNSRVLKLDLATVGWNVFDIPMNSPMVIDDYIYFGSPTAGKTYYYPIGDTDAGDAINSYWKTKNFVGTNPYVEKQYQTVSIIAGSDYGSSLDITYTMDTSTSTSYTISLTSSTADFVRNNRQLPIGELGAFFNMQIGNNAADQPWTFYGASIEYKDDPWRVTD